MLFIFVESTSYLSIYFDKAKSITISSSQIIPAHSFELVRMRKSRASCFADVSRCALSILCVRK